MENKSPSVIVLVLIVLTVFQGVIIFRQSMEIDELYDSQLKTLELISKIVHKQNKNIDKINEIIKNINDAEDVTYY